MDNTSCAGKTADENLARMLEKEREAITENREPPAGAPPPEKKQGTERDLCGLALSGGGIRSATFNLGVLQALAQVRLLEMFDYVATVSGGGYIGGFWTAWRHYHRDKHSEPTALFPMEEPPPSEQGQQPDRKHGSARGAHLPAVRHLREFSNFLSPQLGVLSPDTGRMISATASALVPALLAALSFLLLVLWLWGLFADSLLVGWKQGDNPPWTEVWLSQGLMCGVLTFGALFLLEVLFTQQVKRVDRAYEHQHSRDTPGGDSPRKPLPVVAYGITLLLATGLVFWLWDALLQKNHVNASLYRGVWMQGVEHDLKMGKRLYVFTPAVAWLGAAGILVVLRWLISRFVAMRGHIHRAEVAAVDRVLSRLLILAAFWSLISAFWFSGRFIREFFLKYPGHSEAYTALKTGLAGTVMGLAALFARMQQLFGRRASKPVSPDMKSRAHSHLPQLLAYAILSLILLGMVLLLLGAKDEGWLGLPIWLAVGVTGATLLFFNPSVVGLHAFYRDRIARTFIGAAHGEAWGQTEPHPKDDFRLDEQQPGPGPLHLICCAANDLASEQPMANLYRGADSAVLSRVGFSVGKEWRSWDDIPARYRQVPTLASAMTASGAAFNSHMGSLSMRLGPAVTFLMTTFNLRLGLWLPHPCRARWQGFWRRLERWFLAGLPFYKELLGHSRVHSPHVHLSDGGHFENLALYELVRRHCRFILVSDCGMDSGAEFDDFANAVRRVREDFGAEIRIDLSPLRSVEGKPARQSVVAGEIEYPDGDHGVLLLIKPTLLGNEPADITQYKAHNAAFPHESTGDQFYDEAQWEAYRRLGEHVALTAFRPVQAALEVSPTQEAPGRSRPPDAAKVFALARHEWLPVPAGYTERLSRFAQRATELDLMLKDESGRKLFRQIYKELTELDSRRGGRDWEAEPPSAEELADALHVLRRALLFMEEVFHGEELATYYNHPAYMGLMNYFARWAYAPLLRTWWPLLKTLYSPRFTHFLEEHFSLVTMKRKDVGKLLDLPEGFASSCWREQGGLEPRPYERRFSYALELPHGHKPQYRIQAAQLIARTHHANGTGPLRYAVGPNAGRRVLVWQGDDFYVPPGLWGAGIGDDFLQLVATSPRMAELLTDQTLERGSILAVRLQVNRDASAARRKRWADDMQLYRSHGFSEPEHALEKWLSTLDEELDQKPAMPWKRKHGEVWLRHWLTRTFEPEKREPAAPGGPEPSPLPPPEETGYGEPGTVH